MPLEEPGFTENKRSFAVEGIIKADETVDDNCVLSVDLINADNETVRHVFCDRKNKETVRYYPDLTMYREELDPKREKMNEFGYPVLMADDVNNPEASIRNGCIKAWYSDTEFKAVITNASDVEHGAVFDDGMNFTDEKGRPYSLLEMGNYTIRVSLLKDSKVLASTDKSMIIGKRENQAICRFNPKSHKERMVKWASENGFAVINDLLPGYLDSYLGVWYYHLGLLQMYRANDICLFDDVCANMFVYLIDKTSTSYVTELAYLQKCHKIDDPKYFRAYHYDIGEAEIKNINRKAQIMEFQTDEYLYLCRLDVVNKKAEENVYYMDERHIARSIADFSNATVKAGDDIQIMGVIKPYQMDPEDFTLLADNTYEINNWPDTVVYTLISDEYSVSYSRKANMERIDEESIGNSVFEFYNIIPVSEEFANRKVRVKVEVVDKKENHLDTVCCFDMSVKKESGNRYMSGEDIDMLSLDSYEKELYE